MEKLLRNYADEKGAKPALDKRGNLMMDHEDKFVDISWQEFFTKLENNKNSLVVASKKSSVLA